MLYLQAFQVDEDAPEYRALHPNAKKAAPVDEHFDLVSEEEETEEGSASDGGSSSDEDDNQMNGSKRKREEKQVNGRQKTKPKPK